MRKRQMQQSVQLAASAVVKDRMVFRVFVLREGDIRFNMSRFERRGRYVSLKARVCDLRRNIFFEGCPMMRH